MSVGLRHPLLDAAEKVTGALRFAGDLKVGGLLHARLVHSPHAHAVVRSVDMGGALAVAGTKGVFWHGNTPRFAYNSAIWYEGQEALEDERMFPAVARHVGDRVAAVVAETPEAADAAARLLGIDYQILPAVLDPQEADRQGGPPRDAAGVPTYRSPIVEVRFERGEIGSAFVGPDRVFETTVSTPKTHHCAIEPHVAIASPTEDGRILVLSPCQSVFGVQVVVAKALGVPVDRIQVRMTPIGGSFGGKAEPILEPLCAHFARALGRPVTIRYDRHETCIATRMRSAARGTVRTAFRRDGRIVARHTEVLVDVGAYCTGGDYLPGSMLQRHVRLYDIPHERYRGRAVYTNTTPTGAFRGYGSPQINAIGEIHLDLAARDLGVDPVDLRLRNVVAPGAIEPYTGVSVGNARIRDCLVRGARSFDWTRRRTNGQGTGRWRRGVGMACAAHINGCYPGSDDATTVAMHLRADGRVALLSALHDLGCGSNTSLAQIAAGTLGLRPTDIVIGPADTALCDYDLGTRASRMTYVAGEAVRRAADALGLAIRRAAARLLNCGLDDLVLKDGAVLVPEAVDMPLAALAAQLGARGIDLPQVSESHRSRDNPSSHAAHFAAVAVDSLTGLVRVEEYLAVHDVGRAVNPMLVEGQIHGGIQIGIGYALFEDVDIDPASGNMNGDRFSRYHMANAPEMPGITVELVEQGEPTGPYGAKAVGEIATIPVAATIVNAVNHALGSSLTDLPLLPERIVAALP